MNSIFGEAADDFAETVSCSAQEAVITSKEIIIAIKKNSFLDILQTFRELLFEAENFKPLVCFAFGDTSEFSLRLSDFCLSGQLFMDIGPEFIGF